MAETNEGSWTVLKILKWTTDWFTNRGVDASPRLDAELLLAHVLGVDRVKLYMQFDRPLVSDELTAFRATIKRRAAGEPIAYITGERAFYSIDLKCDTRALIPRPETEVLVEEALARLQSPDGLRVIDIGCGTGAIGLSLATEREDLDVTLTDVSADALALARENADALGLADRVTFAEGDLFAAASGPFDMVVSNPPYVGESERKHVDDAVHEFEPHLALYAGDDGLDVIRRLIPEAREQLKPGGWLLIEIGFQQGDALRELLKNHGFIEIHIRKDYSDLDRVAIAKRPE